MKTPVKKYQIPSLGNRRFIAEYICFKAVDLYEIKEGGKKVFCDTFGCFAEIDEYFSMFTR